LQFLNPLALTSGKIWCHGLGLLAQKFYIGLLHIPGGVWT
jgi:hypothetical protein